MNRRCIAYILAAHARARLSRSTTVSSFRVDVSENNVGAVFVAIGSRADAFFIDDWDSYWIIQGLLKSELYDTVNGTLQNFMDEIRDFGFIPNGGRTYCEHQLVVSYWSV